MKYLDGFRRRITIRIAAYRRKKFSRLIRQMPHWKEEFNINSEEKKEFDFVSFSSSRDIEEQVLSILSLLKWYGYPQNWYIYSDGSHTENDIKILQSLGIFIKFKKWDQNIGVLNHPQKNALYTYASMAPLGKRLLCYITHNIEKQTIFLDSDIIFYRGIKRSMQEISSKPTHWFLPDIGWGTLDSRYTTQQTLFEMYQLNGGFSVLNKGFSWNKAIEFISLLGDKFEYFSEQTAFHIAMQNQNSYPLDPRKFIMHARDQFLFRTLQQNSEITIRHFVSPVRHKIWQNGHEWHLK